MLSKLLLAWCLMAACVTVHAAGLTAALRRLPRQRTLTKPSWHVAWLFIIIAGWVILLHLIEMILWGIVYSADGALRDLQSALYFSAVTYTTTGYGDLVLPVEWRLVGAIEALTGILMCGWSTGFFFAAVSRVSEARSRNA
jgi:Ion channel